ncbi:MAG: hypothetical protein M3160_03365 [Candidatus Eremiobacteraeota bacterium]|nr:hypothetical protein [Candidatus Eremiobacteraeota bacterium]
MFGRASAFRGRLVAGPDEDHPPWIRARPPVPGATVSGDWPLSRPVYNVAVDERASLLVDPDGTATLTQRPRGTGDTSRRMLYSGGTQPANLTRGRPLRYSVQVTHLWHSGQRYPINKHRGDGERYWVTVDGRARSMYSRNPYAK